MCPIQVWKLYTSKLNNTKNYLWQKPRSGRVFYSDKEWYQGRIVGRDPLERFMHFLSTDIKLDNHYTNHSIRATVISTLDNDGFEARHIMKLSSHKKESTIKEYSVKCPDKKKKEMCDSLSNALLPKRQKLNQQATCTVSVNPQETNTDSVDRVTENTSDVKYVANNLPSFNIDPIEDFSTIDDTILANILYETDQNVNNNNGNDTQTDTTQVATIPQTMPVPVSTSTPTKLTLNPQFTANSVTNNTFPTLPQMYFPNSSVTINYNFGKQ